MAFATAAVPVVISSIVFTSIAFILVLTRLYTRLICIQNAGADDFVVLAAMVSTTIRIIKLN